MSPDQLALIVKVLDHDLCAEGGFVVAAVSRAREQSVVGELWYIPVRDGGSIRRLTNGPTDLAPSISPDGRSVAFVRKDARSSQLCICDIATGNVVVLAENAGLGRAATIRHLRGISPPQWSPDGTRLAYVAPVHVEKKYPASTVQRIRDLPYRIDGRGRIDDNHLQIFLIDPHPGAKPRQLSTDLSDHWDLAWRPDGRALCFASNHRMADGSRIQAAHEIETDDDSVRNREYRRLTDGSSTVNLPTYSPDGTTIYFLGIRRVGTDLADIRGRNVALWGVGAGSQAHAPKLLSDEQELDIDDARLRPLIVGAAGEVTVSVLSKGSVNLGVIANGSWSPIIAGKRQIVSYCQHGDITSAIACDERSSGDLFLIRNAEFHRLSTFCDAYKSVSTTDGMEVTTRTSSGYPVHGWLLVPSGRAGPHSLLLLLHGGPDTQWGYFLNEEAQAFVEAGFAVLLPNPRGSAGYGEAHARALNGHVGTVEIEDVLALLDAALDRGDIDPARVGVTGRSYAGFMTAWLASHHGHRFRAALGECAIYDWTSAIATSDIGWQLTGMVGPEPRIWIERSPLTHVDRISIPFMVMQYLSDLRIPSEQGQKFFAALRRSGATTELVQFDGGPHAFAEIGPLGDRIARLEIMIEWFSRWLMQ